VNHVLRGLYVRGGSAGGSVLALCCRSSAYGDWRGTRWQPIFLVTGALVFVIGLTLRNSVAFVSGILMMGSAASDTAPHSPNAAIVHTWMWLHKSRTGNP